jgi:cytochrome d ubiquinol oxidase subunit I
MLRTGDAVSKGLADAHVIGSIVMFGMIYAMLFAVWLMLLDEKIRKGPEPVQ